MPGRIRGYRGKGRPSSAQGLAAASLAALLLAGFSHSLQAGSGDSSKTAAREPDLSAVAPPPFSDGIFPCSDCHTPGEEVNTTRRALTDAHEDIILKHDEENRWCLDCHDAGNRDKLHLANGRQIDFTESYKLCGQCHGEKLRDWKAGVHGKRTGEWNGVKQYLLCAHCHNPHSPRFQPLTPMPPPVKPGALR